MPEVRHALRGARLAAVLAGVGVLLGTQLVWSTVARRRGGARELRRLKARLVEGRTQGDRERRQNAELIAAADRLVRTAALLHDRATEARRTAQLEESREPLAEPAMQAVSLVAGAPFMSDDAARALGDLAWVDGQLAAAADSLGVLSALLKQRTEDVAAAPALWPVRGVVPSTFGLRLSPYAGGAAMPPFLPLLPGQIRCGLHRPMVPTQMLTNVKELAY